MAEFTGYKSAQNGFSRLFLQVGHAPGENFYLLLSII